MGGTSLEVRACGRPRGGFTCVKVRSIRGGAKRLLNLPVIGKVRVGDRAIQVPGNFFVCKGLHPCLGGC